MEDKINKICGHCQIDKPISEYNKCATGRLGYHNHCRSCQKETRKNWYIKHREREIEKAIIYGKSEKAKNAAKKRWNKEKERLKLINNTRRRTPEARAKARIQRNKWREIPHNKIACSLRGRIRAALKGISKIEITESLTGCSFIELKIYLESKFLPGMSWDNYGEWHVDHIKPCASFDLTDSNQQKECFHFSNLQPLWAKDNLSKGAFIN